MNIRISNKTKIMAAIGLLAAFTVGGTMAYMTDRETAENIFTVGKVDFNLYEESWDGEQPDGTYATPSEATPSEASPSDALGVDQARDLYSGKVINKDPAIKNNSRNDAYLRMSVKIPVANVVTADEYGELNNDGIPEETELFTYIENADSGMTRVSDIPEVATGSDAGRAYHVYEYMYTGDGDTEIPVPAGQDIPPLFNQVMFANVIEGQVDEAMEFLTVDYKAIQSGGFVDPDEAWAAYNRQNPGR